MNFRFHLNGKHRRAALAASALTAAVLCLSACQQEEPAASVTNDAQPAMAETSVTQPPAAAQAFPLRFSNVSDEAGVDMILASGELPSTQIIEVKGNGLALLDYNNNGMLDLFVPNGATMADTEHGPGWRLYENVSVDDALRFRDVTAEAGITHTRWAFGAAVGDFDDDGWQDIYVTCYGPNVLLRNTGDGRFEDVTAEAFGRYHGSPSRESPDSERSEETHQPEARLGESRYQHQPEARLGESRYQHQPEARLGEPRYQGQWSTSAAFGDVTGDGRLDLYIANYIAFDVNNFPPSATFLSTEVFAGPHGLPAQPDVLYANTREGTFQDISQPSGILVPMAAWGLGAVILDFNLNGLQDIYVGNDSMRNFLFINRRLPVEDRPDITWMKFDEVGMVSGIGSSGSGANQATMGIGIGDVNNNALPDVFTTNFSSDMNTLHVNVGTGIAGNDVPTFEDRTSQHGLGVPSRRYLGWACGFFDLDLNGQEEIVIVNGHIYPQATLALLDSQYEQPPLLFKVRRGKGVYYDRVTDERAGSWLNEPHRDRALVFGDLNRNGLIDMIVGEMNGKPRVLRNDSDPQGDWLIVELRQPGHNLRALGSRIELFAENSLHTRWIYSGGFMSANPAEAHFGFRRGAEPLRLRITWPDGHEQWVEDVQPNRRMVVSREG